SCRRGLHRGRQRGGRARAAAGRARHCPLVTRLAGLVALATPAIVPPAPAPRPNPADLEAELVCPVCETTLDQSNAPVAQKMKAFIRARIAAGDSEQKIKDALVAQFGEGVLARPPRGGFGALAWALPLVALAVGAVAI